MINTLISFKRIKLYKFFLLYLIKPIYDLIWQYIINFQGKILYFLWFIKKKKLIDLENNDKKLIENNNNIKSLAEKIYNHCSLSIIKDSREELFDEKISSINKTNSGEKKYNQDIFDRISSDLKKEIFELAHSEILISTAAKYLKVFPILGKVLLYHNVPNKPEEVRGAMYWHKDDFGYRSLDLFVAITDVDEENGPLSTIKQKNIYGIFSKSSEENKSQNMAGERGKITDNHFEKLDENNILTLKGKKGTSLLIDSFTAYHRGGHCLSKDRMMLRFSYQTPDSIRIKSSGFHKIEEFNKLKQNFSLNIFLNYLYKKKPSKIILILRNYLMKFYRIAHIKEN